MTRWLLIDHTLSLELSGLVSAQEPTDAVQMPNEMQKQRKMPTFLHVFIICLKFLINLNTTFFAVFFFVLTYHNEIDELCLCDMKLGNKNKYVC